ncbi:MAG TPA: arginine--tRNA ligase [Tepidisphaeraceae bacterium]
MQTIQAQLDRAFRATIHSVFSLDVDPLISLSQNDKFGDYQSNVAMSLAKLVSEKIGQKTNPRQVAEQIKANLQLGEMASETSIAGPGFINVRLSTMWLVEQLRSTAHDGRLGIEPAGAPEIVVVDYSGPNIAKELHVGHLRSTIIGDAISRIIEFQRHQVIRQNHIGDWGTQFGMLIAYLERLDDASKDPYGTLLGIKLMDFEQFYRDAKATFDTDPQFAEQARKAVVRLQSGEVEARASWNVICLTTRQDYEPLYKRLAVQLADPKVQAEPIERGESFYNPMLADVVRELKEKGIATESEGATVVFNKGFENPLIIEKTGGGYLYATTDLAAIRYRAQTLHARRIIYTHDSRQAQHFAQVFATAKRAGWADGVSLEYAPFGTMLGADNKPFKTRSGDTVKLKELLDEAEERAYALVSEKNPQIEESQRRQIAHSVGVGAVKYADLSKDRTSDYVFAWDKALAMDGNTAPYLQYAHARIKSIFRKADTQDPARAAEHLQLDSPFELALAKHILRLGEVLDVVARELKPHYLCIYLYELATRFSAFYENCPVLQSQEPLRSSRLALCDLTARTLALGLDLLGIEHPEQM